MKKILLIVFLTFTAAFTPIAAKVVVNAISPLSLAFLRFGTATLLLLAVFRFYGLNFKIDKKDRALFVFLALLVIPINQFYFLNGIKLSVASHSGVLYACTPLIVYIASIKTKNETFNYRKLFSISLTILGILIIFYENLLLPENKGKDFIAGDILLFFAVASWSLYLAFSQNMVLKYGALKTQTISFTLGIIFYIPLFIMDFGNLNFDKVNFYTILGFLHLTILVAFGSYFLYSYSIKVIKSSTLTTMTNMSPVVTIIFSWLLLNENLSYFFMAGAAVTMLGVFFTQRVKDEMPISTLN